MQWMTFAIPIITVLLGILVGSVKEKYFDTGKARKLLKEKQLIELYNRIFVIFIKNNSRLEIEWTIEEIELEVESGEEEIEEEIVEIRELDFDPELWNNVYNEVSEIVYEKINLLDYDDLSLWYEVEFLFQEIKSNEDIYEAYNTFKRFLTSAVDTYGHLYHEFHLGKRKDSKIKKLKEKLRGIKMNPLIDKDEKKKKIKEVTDEINKVKKHNKRHK